MRESKELLAVARSCAEKSDFLSALAAVATGSQLSRDPLRAFAVRVYLAELALRWGVTLETARGIRRVTVVHAKAAEAHLLIETIARDLGLDLSVSPSFESDEAQVARFLALLPKLPVLVGARFPHLVAQLAAMEELSISIHISDYHRQLLFRICDKLDA